MEKRTHTHVGNWPAAIDRMYLPGGPVESVTSVTIGGMAVAVSDFEVYRDSVEVMTWLSTPGRVVVTYVGGWEAPRNLPAKEAVIARTARWLNKRTDDDVGTESSSVEGHTVKWMADGFTPAELAACERLRAPDLVL